MKRILIVLTVILTSINIMAQNRLTHAQAASRKWKGFDVTNVLGDSQYADNGKRFYLYNIGTGRFIIDGGNWGMEGRLFYETFGRTMFLYSDAHINAGITEKAASKNCFCVRPPEPFGINWANDTYNKSSLTTLMDGDSTKMNSQKWVFERVEGETGDTCTYYMYQQCSTNFRSRYYDKNSKFYLGVAYGECHNTSVGKGDGKFVFLDDDRAGWTTANVIDNDSLCYVNGDLIPIKDLYKWRLVSEEEFLSALNDENAGINPSVSCLLNDGDLTRNSNYFVDSWKTERLSNVDYTIKGRKGFTEGLIKNNQRQSPYYNDAWNTPLRLKIQFDEMKTAKYGFLTFEGAGRTYTKLNVTKPGWYRIQCYGFSNTDAYLFARLNGNKESTYVSIPMIKDTRTFQRDKIDSCLVIGKELTLNGEQYKNSLWICVTNEQLNNGNDSIQLGIEKNTALQSEGETKDGKVYYYDKEFVCADNFQVTYMGKAPSYFYDNETTLDYLQDSENKQYKPLVNNGRYSGAVNLEREFKINQWNSFSFPLPLTGEQIRYAFGEDAKLVKLHSIGKLSNNENIIDFQTIELRTTDIVVEPGTFYMLYPTIKPSKDINPKNELTTYYNMGKLPFSINESETTEYPYSKLELSKTNEETTIESYLNKNDGTSFVSYVNGCNAPKGSYVVSKGSIYHLSKQTSMKGFRGYITTSNGNNANEQRASIMIFDNYANNTDITLEIKTLFNTENKMNNTAIYNITGQRVNSKALGKGIYIINNKKVVIK